MSNEKQSLPTPTPWPWEIRFEHRSHPLQGEQVHIKASAVYIAKVNTNIEEWQANAELIAQAPETAKERDRLLKENERLSSLNKELVEMLREIREGSADVEIGDSIAARRAAHTEYSGRIEELEGLLREARYDINHDTINEDLADRITATLSPKEEPKTP